MYADIIDLVLNRYRIMLSRATKKQYVWFKDENTKQHFIEYFMLDQQNNTGQ